MGMKNIFAYAVASSMVLLGLIAIDLSYGKLVIGYLEIMGEGFATLIAGTIGFGGVALVVLFNGQSERARRNAEIIDRKIEEDIYKQNRLNFIFGVIHGPIELEVGTLITYKKRNSNEQSAISLKSAWSQLLTSMSSSQYEWATDKDFLIGLDKEVVIACLNVSADRMQLLNTLRIGSSEHDGVAHIYKKAVTSRINAYESRVKVLKIRSENAMKATNGK